MVTSMRRRLSLHVGINDYPGSGADLRGCVNDAMDWQNVAGPKGYTGELLLDAAATKNAILSRLRAFVEVARFGDRILFTYSGHGSYIADLDGDELDGRDEVLCCHDYNRGGLLSDDELYKVFAEAHRGVRVTIFSDSCHSGTMARFATPQLLVSATPRFLAPEVFLSGEPLNKARAVRTAAASSKPRTGPVLISGCADSEYSYDATFLGRPNGAATYFALNAIKAGYKHVGEVHGRMRQALPSAVYPQSPQLTATTYQKRTALL